MVYVATAVVNVSVVLDPSGHRFHFPAGEPYVVTRNMAALLLSQDPPSDLRRVVVEDGQRRAEEVFLTSLFTVERLSGALFKQYRGEDLNGKLLLKYRPGGMGDVLFDTPATRELKRKFPLSFIAFCTSPHCCRLLEENDDYGAVIPAPIPLLGEVGLDGRVVRWGWTMFHYHVDLDGSIEYNPEARRRHACDIMADYSFVTLPEGERRMRYIVRPEERELSRRRYPKKRGEVWVGYQPFASAPPRTYPGHKARLVIQGLLNRGYHVFLLGAKDEVIEIDAHPRLHPPCGDFREAAALAERMDCIVAQDSVWTHMAGALGVPCVALYSAFPAALRLQDGAPVVALGDFEACECKFHHGDFPENRRCAVRGECAAFEYITPRRVLDAVEEVLERYGRKEDGEAT